MSPVTYFSKKITPPNPPETAPLIGLDIQMCEPFEGRSHSNHHTRRSTVTKEARADFSTTHTFKLNIIILGSTFLLLHCVKQLPFRAILL